MSNAAFHTSLRRWERRRRLGLYLAWLPYALLISAGLAATFALAGRIWPLFTQNELLFWAGGFLIASIILPGLYLQLRRESALELARRFDLIFGLAESISTMLELDTGAIGATTDEVAARQETQAERFTAAVDHRELLPLRTDARAWAALLIPLIAFGLLAFLPSKQQELAETREHFEEVIAEEIESLEELIDEIEESEELTAEESEMVSQILDEAIRELSERDISEGEALAALDSASDALSDLSETSSEEQMDALDDALSEAENESLAGADALADLAEALEGMDLESMTSEELSELAETLSEMAESLESINPELAEALQAAASQMLNGDLSAAQASLAAAASEMTASDMALAELSEALASSGANIAQAGVPGAGEGGMGVVQGTGSGASEDPGNGASGGGAGRGEGSSEATGGIAGGNMSTDNGAGDGGIQLFEDLYAPQRVGGEGEDIVDLSGDESGPALGIEGDLADNPTGASMVPYNEVYADYEGAVAEALENGYIPLGLRDLIGDYFSGLDPDT